MEAEDEQIFNENTMYIRIPTMVFLVIAVLIGLVGNTAIIYIYGFRMKRTNLYLFINYLSVTDIASCVIVIPLEMYRLCMYYSYDQPLVCKMEIYFFFACYINSTFLLLIISVDRYMRVCRYSSRQMEFTFAKKLGLMLAVIALLLALPAWFWADTESFVVESTVIAERCSPYIGLSFESYALFVIGVTFPAWAIMLVLYLHVFRKIKEQAHLSATVGITKRTSVRGQIEEELSNYSRSMICITFVFMATCTLYFALRVVDLNVKLAHPTHPINYLMFSLNEIWVISTVTNPFIFGFMNTDFRIELFKILRIKQEDEDNEEIEGPISSDHAML